MAMLSKGVEVFAQVIPRNQHAYGSHGDIFKVECAKAFNPGGSRAESLDVTTIFSAVAEFVPGLRIPGQATLTVDADPSRASHLRLYNYSQKGHILKWAVGWGDGTDVPTLNANGRDMKFSTNRTWFVFKGYVADFPFRFELNAPISTDISIQRTGESAWIPKSA